MSINIDTILASKHASLSDLMERSLFVFLLAKPIIAPGWNLVIVISSPELMKEFRKVHLV